MYALSITHVSSPGWFYDRLSRSAPSHCRGRGCKRQHTRNKVGFECRHSCTLEQGTYLSGHLQSSEALFAHPCAFGLITLQVQDFNISVRLVKKTRWGLYKVPCTPSYVVRSVLMLKQVVGECRSFSSKVGDAHQPLNATNVLMQPTCKVCGD